MSVAPVYFAEITPKSENNAKLLLDFMIFEENLVILHLNKNIKMAETKDINRIKVMQN